uniref:Peroxisomal biogenesis factor 11 beta n=1 Tax=Mus musculus TaxID=10090 RepID=D6RFR1_MOUSE
MDAWVRFSAQSQARERLWPPSMPVPFSAMLCRDMGLVPSYRNRFDNWRVI